MTLDFGCFASLDHSVQDRLAVISKLGCRDLHCSKIPILLICSSCLLLDVHLPICSENPLRSLTAGATRSSANYFSMRVNRGCWPQIHRVLLQRSNNSIIPI